MATIAELLEAANRKVQSGKEIKVSIKAAINDPALGNKFADYPVAITDGKAYIAQKITEKGVAASGSDTFQQLGDKVGEIQQGAQIETATVGIYFDSYFKNYPQKVFLVDSSFSFSEFSFETNPSGVQVEVIIPCIISVSAPTSFASGEIENIETVQGPMEYPVSGFYFLVTGNGTIQVSGGV